MWGSGSVCAHDPHRPANIKAHRKHYCWAKATVNLARWPRPLPGVPGLRRHHVARALAGPAPPLGARGARLARRGPRIDTRQDLGRPGRYHLSVGCASPWPAVRSQRPWHLTSLLLGDFHQPGLASSRPTVIVYHMSLGGTYGGPSLETAGPQQVQGLLSGV